MLSFVGNKSATTLLYTQNSMTPVENMDLDLFKTGINLIEVFLIYTNLSKKSSNTLSKRIEPIYTFFACQGTNVLNLNMFAL